MTIMEETLMSQSRRQKEKEQRPLVVTSFIGETKERL